MTQPPPVARLVHAARGGDTRAFGELVERFQSMAQGYAVALLRDPGLAEDACQEAFVDAFLHLYQLREDAAFPAWFRRVVRKHADRQRRSRLLATELSEFPGATDPLTALLEAEDAIGAGRGGGPSRALARLDRALLRLSLIHI